MVFNVVTKSSIAHLFKHYILHDLLSGKPYDIVFGGETLQLLPEKVILWPSQHSLLVADLHFGKSAHFRSKGIALPQTPEMQDLDKLGEIIAATQAKQVLFLGDLFHSRHTFMVEPLAAFMKKNADTKFILIEGNHDVLHSKTYASMQLEVQKQMQIGDITLTHEPQESPQGYNICGHIHPGIRVSTAPRQSMKLPCFAVSKNQIIMPAFGSLTGLFELKRQSSVQFMGIVGRQVLAV
ncbi:MAG: ligase-associated damage response endonuclease PdeM [Bacteroidota bacterium]